MNGDRSTAGMAELFMSLLTTCTAVVHRLGAGCTSAALGINGRGPEGRANSPFLLAVKDIAPKLACDEFGPFESLARARICCCYLQCKNTRVVYVFYETSRTMMPNDPMISPEKKRTYHCFCCCC